MRTAVKLLMGKSFGERPGGQNSVEKMLVAFEAQIADWSEKSGFEPTTCVVQTLGTPNHSEFRYFASITYKT